MLDAEASTIWLLRTYTDAGNGDRVYEIDGVVQAADYDPDIAGGYLLALDMRRLASEDTLNQLRKILNEDLNKLATEMMRAQRHAENVQELVTTYLQLLLRGLS
ncbi:hypothetical protein [Duganella sp.]|uniref:hypothetical protein n=1 Tax=Duganella sp. TaxID=1904440 RepID=UPI0031CE6F62